MSFTNASFDSFPLGILSSGASMPLQVMKQHELGNSISNIITNAI